MWWDKIINAIPWLICKLWFKVVMPIFCFLKGWLTFAILWLKANTIDFVVNLLEQISAAFSAAIGVLWAVLQLFWLVLVLLFSVIAYLAGLIADLVGIIFSGDSRAIAGLDDNIIVAMYEIIEWFVLDTPFILFFLLVLAFQLWDFVDWAIEKLSAR